MKPWLQGIPEFSPFGKCWWLHRLRFLTVMNFNGYEWFLIVIDVHGLSGSWWLLTLVKCYLGTTSLALSWIHILKTLGSAFNRYFQAPPVVSEEAAPPKEVPSEFLWRFYNRHAVQIAEWLWCRVILLFGRVSLSGGSSWAHISTPWAA